MFGKVLTSLFLTNFKDWVGKSSNGWKTIIVLVFLFSNVEMILSQEINPKLNVKLCANDIPIKLMIPHKSILFNRYFNV